MKPTEYSICPDCGDEAYSQGEPPLSGGHCWACDWREIDRLTAENDKMRSALHDITGSTDHQEAIRIAAQALSSTQD